MLSYFIIIIFLNPLKSIKMSFYRGSKNPFPGPFQSNTFSNLRLLLGFWPLSRQLLEGILVSPLKQGRSPDLGGLFRL